MTTPTDYPDRVRALLEAATPGEWRAINGVDDPDPAWGSFPVVVTEPSGAPDDGGDDVAIVRNRSNGDAALMAESKRLARAYLAAREEVERLTRVLAVEGGDESAAPEGWRPAMGGAWSGKDDNYVHRIGAGRWSWVSRDTRNKVRGRGEAPTALEAMEAADRAAGGAA